MRRTEMNLGSIKICQATLDAIAYLSLWAYQTGAREDDQAYDKLSLYQEHGTQNIQAAYSSSTKPGKYFIMAVFNEDSGKYSFHS